MSDSENTPRQSESVQERDDTLRRTELVAARNAWIGAEPTRGFEVSVNRERTEWRVQLTQRGQVVATGSGTTWESALAAALEGVGPP